MAMKTNRFQTGFALIISALLLASCGSEKNESISFTKLTASKQINCPGDTVKCFDVDYNVELPSLSLNDEVEDLIRATLVTDIFGEKYVNLPNSDLLDAYITDCESEFNMMSTDLDEFASANFYEERVEAVQTLQDAEHQLLSYEMTRYMYTGGAHGMGSTICWVFDLENGNQLTEDDIFTADATDQIIALLNNALKAYTAKNNLALSDFFTDQIAPNGNFSITDEGICYLFNPYDIAPYAMGETRLLIGKESLRPILRDETPVYQFYFGEK